MNKYLVKIAENYSTDRSSIADVARGIASPAWQESHIAKSYGKTRQSDAASEEAKGRVSYVGRAALEGVAGASLLGLLSYKMPFIKSKRMLNNFANFAGGTGSKILHKIDGKRIPFSGGKTLNIPDTFKSKDTLKSMLHNLDEEHYAKKDAMRGLGKKLGGGLGETLGNAMAGQSPVQKYYNAYHGALLGGTAGVTHGLYASSKNRGDTHHANYSSY